MAPRTPSSASYRLAGSILLVVLLVGLLSACGSQGGSSSESPAQRTEPGRSHAPDPLPDPPAPASVPEATVAADGAAGEAERAALEPVAGAPAEGALGDAASIGPLPTMTPPERAEIQSQQVALKAGAVDDNADFAAYREYQRTYTGPAPQLDLSERYLITVLNDRQQPVLDARVRLFAGEQQVFEGKTYAGGQTLFFPGMDRQNHTTAELRVLIEKGNSVVEGRLARGQDETWVYVLPGAAALPEQPRLDVLFLLDATGSMQDEIARIQETIVSIADRVDRLEPRPQVRFGLVAYRDHGDEFVTRTYDFVADVVTFQELLLSIRADGGGDTPEALDEGLYEAIHSVGWSSDALRLVFLVADAPPHLEASAQPRYDYLALVRDAVTQGVKIYPIAASNSDADAEFVFRQLAQQTLARFIFLTYQPGQNSGTPGDTTTHHVDPQAFSVERLDDLVVQVIEQELALAQGMS